MTDQTNDAKQSANDALRLTVQIVAAYLSNNEVDANAIPDVLKSVHSALGSLSEPGQATVAAQPAVPIKKSITPDYLICLEDGKQLKMLKRYLRSQYQLSPEDYRKKWGLPSDYPMVAPNYAERRSQFAKEIGLGRQQKTPAKKTSRSRKKS